jgi:hypothetical protein
MASTITAPSPLAPDSPNFLCFNQRINGGMMIIISTNAVNAAATTRVETYSSRRNGPQ